MRKTYLYLKLWLPVIVWCGIIFYLSSIPDLSSGLEKTLDMVLRKGAHAVEYAVLTFLLWRAIVSSFRMDISWVHRSSIIIAVLYAVSDEVHQAFVPNRGPAIMDVIIDSIGAAIALWIIIKRKRGESNS